MREKISEHTTDNDIKNARGGLLDLEFLVQYLVLAHPEQDIAQCTNTRLLIQRLHHNRMITRAQSKQLIKAYRHYHQALHQQVLQSTCKDYSIGRLDVLKISQQYFRT